MVKTPKVLCLFPSNSIGGSEKCMLELSSQCPDDHGYEYILAAPPGGDFKKVASGFGVEVVGLGGARTDNPLIGVFQFPAFIRAVNKLLSERHVNILYAFGFKSLLIGALLSLYKKNFRLVFGFRWNADENSLLNTALGCVAPVIRSRIKAVIVNSRHSANVLLKRRRFESYKIKVIRNGKILTEEPKKKTTKSRTATLILTVANLTPVKNHELYLELCIKPILRRHTNIEFWFVGRDELNGRLHHLVRAENLENKVIFYGFKDDVTLELQAAQILVLPSKSEGFPMSILEAMGHAKPAVAFNVGGVSELVEHNATGFVVPPFDWAAMQQAIETLALSAELREEFGKAARAKVEREFTVARMRQEHKEVFDEILSVS